MRMSWTRRGRRLTAALLAMVFGAVLGTAPAAQAEDAAFDSKPPVSLEAYLGLWYEAGRTPNSFEDNQVRRNGKDFGACFNVTARYSVKAKNEINVLNTCTRASADGATITDTAKGIAQVKDPGRNRKLAVAFGPAFARGLQRLIQLGRPNYWIYCLGPIQRRGTFKGLYAWAVVSDRNRDGIFVLTRAKKPSRQAWAAIRSCLAAERLPADKLIYKQK